MTLYEVDGCLLTIEEINQRFKEFRDKLAKAQDILNEECDGYPNCDDCRDPVDNKPYKTRCLRHQLGKALKGACE